MPAATARCLEIVVEATAGAKKIVNVFHYNTFVAVASVNKNLYRADFIANGPMSAMLATLSDQYVPDRVRCRWFDDPLDPYDDIAGVGAGAIAGDAGPDDSAVYVRLVTPQRGRSYMGSKHFSPYSEDDTEHNLLSNTVNPTSINRWGNLANSCLYALNDGLGGQTAIPVVWSRQLTDLAGDPTNPVTSTIVSVKLNLTIGTMRHRRPVTTVNP